MAHSWHEKSDKDLEKMLAERRTRLRQFWFNLAGGQVTKVKEGRQLRREMARILTILNQRKQLKQAGVRQ